MTDSQITPPFVGFGSPGGDARERPVIFADVMRSEWTKFRSLRSTVYTLLLTVVLAVGIGALIANGKGSSYSGLTAEERAAFDPTSTSLTGCFLLAQLTISILGVLVVTSEYATGMIRTSLAVVPRRGRLLAAKMTVFAAVALAGGLVAGLGAFLTGQSILEAHGAPHASLDEGEVLRAVLGSGLYLSMVGLLGVALGVLVRATAGAIAILVTTNLLIPLLAGQLPDVVGKFWPTTAGGQVMVVNPDPGVDALGPWAGFTVLSVFTALALAVAVAIFRRRNA